MLPWSKISTFSRSHRDYARLVGMSLRPEAITYQKLLKKYFWAAAAAAATADNILEGSVTICYGWQ